MAAPAPRAPHHPGYATAESRGNNGTGVASLCCGLAGILLGLMPILFQASGALGIIAIVLGFIGAHRASHGRASNHGVAIGGLVTGILALGLAIYGLSIVLTSLQQLNTDLGHGLNGAHALVQAQHVILRQESHLIHQLLWIGNG